MAINHAPKRKDILTDEEKVLAVRNALRYFPTKFHSILAKEFAQELHDYGRIYMYRFRPDYEMYARPIDEYPAKSRQACCDNGNDPEQSGPARAQHRTSSSSMVATEPFPELGAVPPCDAVSFGND